MLEREVQNVLQAVCVGCWDFLVGHCPFHGPLTVVEDTKVAQDPTDPTRAERTVPLELCISDSAIFGAGRGVWTRVPLARGLRFGPYEGEKVNVPNNSPYQWEIFRNSQLLHWVDGKDCCKANWMRYVNCARNVKEQNLEAFQYKGEIYYRTLKDIPAHTELLLWYGNDEYARELGIDVKNFDKPEQKQTYVVFGCERCCSAYKSPLCLEEHRNCHGSKDKRKPKSCAVCHMRCKYKHRNARNVIWGSKLSHCNGQENSNRHVELMCTSDDSDSRCFQQSDLLECDRQDRYQGDLHSQQSVPPGCLNARVNTHTGESSYNDKQCGQKLAVQTSPFKQRQTVRMGGNQYVCTRRGNRVQDSITDTRECQVVLENCDEKSSNRLNQIRYTRDKCDNKFAHNGLGLKQRHTVHMGRCNRVQHSITDTRECQVVLENCDEKSSNRLNQIRYTRDKCDNKFAHNGLGLKQRQTVHMAGKPYVRAQCGDRITHKTSLVQHSRIHTRDRPVVPENCCEKFTNRSSQIRNTGEKCDYKQVCSQIKSHKSKHNTHKN